MKNKGPKAIFLGIGIFLGFGISKLIAGQELFTIEALLPALVGGLIAGLVVYYSGNWFSKKKN